MITIQNGERRILPYRFENDGIIPNSKLPVLIYRSVVDFGILNARLAQKELKKIAKGNDWYVDWLASIYKKLHYHSTAHEGLIVYEGKASLHLGGSRIGYNQIYEINRGDAVIIPAGVGHQRKDSTESFKVFGLYPKGQTWDIQWGEQENYADSVKQIREVPLPNADPIFGKTGGLKLHWR